MNEQFAFICERFDREWKSGSRPNLSSFLRQADGSEMPELARVLLEVDLRHRIERGERPSRDEYRLTFFSADFDWSMLFEQALTKAASTRGQASSDTSISQELTQIYQTPRATEPQFPERIGRYRLEGVLGKGNSGVVYAAWDDTLQRNVAMKLPLLARSDEQIGRLIEEARLVAGLSHPAIVPIFDCGRLADGRWFLVYEIMTGGTLSDELQRGRPTIDRAIEIASAVAEGLHFAHLAGIYHRDLKTRNILLTANGRPKISDFGLAIHEDVLPDQRDVIAGSPAYMSPEQARGESHLLDGRSDIWSMGVIFYEMLTGQRPFRSNSIDGLFELIQKKDPRPPRQFDASIDQELERICLKCLQKSPSDRYLVAQDFITDLSRWRTQTDASQVPKTRTETLSESSSQSAKLRTKRLLMVFGVSGILILASLMAISGAFSGLITKRSPTDPSPAFVKSADKKRDDAKVIPASTKSGEWKPLLRTPMVVLAQPDDMRNTQWKLSEAGDFLSVATDHTLLFKFDDTKAENIELRLRFHQANWTGGIGVFWGGEQRSGLGGTRPWVFQTILAPPLMPGDKERILRLSWRRVNLLRNALFGQVDIWQVVKREIPLRVDHELIVQIRDRRVFEVVWNGETMNQLVQLSNDFTDDVTSSPGAVGLILSKTQLVVQDFSLKISE